MKLTPCLELDADPVLVAVVGPGVMEEMVAAMSSSGRGSGEVAVCCGRGNTSSGGSKESSYRVSRAVSAQLSLTHCCQQVCPKKLEVWDSVAGPTPYQPHLQIPWHTSSPLWRRVVTVSKAGVSNIFG